MIATAASDFIEHLITVIEVLGAGARSVGVCQPRVAMHAGLRDRQILLEVQQCAKRCAVDFDFTHCHEAVADWHAIDAISGAAVAQSRARDKFANRRDCPLKNISGRAEHWVAEHRGSHVGNRAERPGGISMGLKLG